MSECEHMECANDAKVVLALSPDGEGYNACIECAKTELFVAPDQATILQYEPKDDE